MRFGAKLQKLMDDMNLGDRLVAEKLGEKSGTTVGRWRKGEGEPSLSVAYKIAKYFNVSMEYLADDDMPVRMSAQSHERERQVKAIVDRIGVETAWKVLTEAIVSQAKTIDAATTTHVLNGESYLGNAPALRTNQPVKMPKEE